MKAAEILGGISELAAEFNVSPQAVHKWTKRGAPSNRCIHIETLTRGEVTRYDLRPDVFGTDQ